MSVQNDLLTPPRKIPPTVTQKTHRDRMFTLNEYDFIYCTFADEFAKQIS